MVAVHHDGEVAAVVEQQVGRRPSGQRTVCSTHHQYSSSVSPFQANTGTPRGGHRRGGVVLGREDVARRPAHLGTERDAASRSAPRSGSSCAGSRRSARRRAACPCPYLARSAISPGISFSASCDLLAAPVGERRCPRPCSRASCCCSCSCPCLRSSSGLASAKPVGRRPVEPIQPCSGGSRCLVPAVVRHPAARVLEEPHAADVARSVSRNRWWRSAGTTSRSPDSTVIRIHRSSADRMSKMPSPSST